ncbi:unnamed protein product [Dracunculus medinensis]|uniref:Prefoldin subunit 2 n=1 Tax=Dracunculus medinensis TaxID=318479 RepID=A0A0N4UFH5_DRAME|nr:unnamed protein product [Dracunculus medinensis]
MTKDAANGRLNAEKEAVVNEFQKLREQQRELIIEVARVEEDRREHKRVLDALETMEDDANCYRLIGGSLVQYQVVAIRPILSTNLAGLEKLCTSLKDQLEQKGKELDDYSNKHNIHFITDREIYEMESESKAERKK